MPEKVLDGLKTYFMTTIFTTEKTFSVLLELFILWIFWRNLKFYFAIITGYLI